MTTMKKIYSFLLAACAGLSLASCMNDDMESPVLDYEQATITSTTDVGTTNIKIAALKDKYASTFRQANAWLKIEEDLVFEGVVCANDRGGGLYQSILLRDIDNEAGTDQCIQLAIKNTCLYPYFKLGQRVKVNLNGLYVGCYGYVPKVGQPYLTSNGNMRLGPVLLSDIKTRVQLLGMPNPGAPELVPLEPTDAWFQANMTYKNVPMLAKVTGTFDEVSIAKKNTAAEGELDAYKGQYEPLPKVFAPLVLRDDGYGVDRTLVLRDGKTKLSFRSSTSCEFANVPLPEDERSYTGMLSFYGSEWQMQLRYFEDIYPNIEMPNYQNQ